MGRNGTEGSAVQPWKRRKGERKKRRERLEVGRGRNDPWLGWKVEVEIDVGLTQHARELLQRIRMSLTANKVAFLPCL